MERNKEKKERKQRKRRKKEREKERKKRKGRRKDVPRLHPLNYRRSDGWSLSGREFKVRLLDEGYAPRGRDSSSFGISTLRDFWPDFFKAALF